jgi:hypothetical protein
MAYASRRGNLRGESHDIFVSSVNDIQIIGGGLVRITFNVNRVGDNGVLTPEPCDDALVMPLAAIPDGIGKALAVTARTIYADKDQLLVLQ